MIYDIFSGFEHAGVGAMLYHNQIILGCKQGHKSPFHHKEEVATRVFDARITALFYQQLPPSVNIAEKDSIDAYIKKLSPKTFLVTVEELRQSIFKRENQSSASQEFSAHVRFLQQIETYKSLKHAIKHADVGIIQQVFARCCLLFHSSNKSKYAFLSLYMTWLTHTGAAEDELQKAILANSLVNLRGTEDGWFEMDRLNEFFNLHMKNIMVTQQTSTLDIHDLFRHTALTASYCTDLKIEIEAAFGQYSNSKHHIKDASLEVRNLAFDIAKSGSIRHWA
jgi:hypothetical protein